MRQAEKADAGKLRMHLVPGAAVRALVRAFEFGTAKYEIESWRRIEGWRERCYDALTRHRDAWFEGEKHDRESGLPHAAHMMWNACVIYILDGYDEAAETEALLTSMAKQLAIKAERMQKASKLP